MRSKDSQPYKFSFSGLNTQVFFFVIVPISLLLLFISFGSMAMHQNAMRNLVGERDLRTVQSATAAIREQLNHRSAAIKTIASRTNSDETLEDILSSFEFLIDDFDVGIAFYSTGGNLLSFSGEKQIWAEITSQADVLFSSQQPLMASSPVFLDPVYIDNRNEFIALVLYQIDPDGPIAVGGFSITGLARKTLSGVLSFENQGAIILVDQQANVLYQSGALDLNGQINTHPGVYEALLGESGTTYFMAEYGEHVIAFGPISPTNWALVIEEPWEAVASPRLRYSEAGPLILVPIVVFALFALWFGTKRIIQPLSKFQKQAISFTRGNYEAFQKPVGGITEIQTLQHTFIDMAKEVQNAQQTLKSFLGLITTSQEEERKRLARELHDDTLQSLIALNQRIMLAKRQDNQEKVQNALVEIETMVSQTIQELRRLSRALRPIYLEDLGLVTALETLAVENSESSNIPIKFFTKGEECRLPDYVEIAIFRISQEGLSNIVRHSKASSAAMSISFLSDRTVLMITDNGKGFIPPSHPMELSEKGHFGLLGIYERAELINANVNVISEIGGGTQIVLQIP